MPIGIHEFAYELGEQQHFDLNEDIHEIPAADSRLLCDMITACCSRLKTSPDAIYIAHSLPITGEGLSGAFGCPIFWISGMPCAVMHSAVRYAVLQIRRHKYSSVWVIGADKAYSERERKFWNTIMGDAVIALSIADDTDMYNILGSYLNTRIYAAHGENSNEGSIAEYRKTLPLLLRDAYEQCLDIAGIREVDYIAPHTPNRKVWDAFAAAAKFERGRILDDNIKNTGHFNSHDSFYHFLKSCEQNIIKPQETAMLINPGFGGTQGCTIIRR